MISYGIKASDIGVITPYRGQLQYLKDYKICKYEKHYFARFRNGEIVEAYVLSGEDVLQLILPRVKKQFEEGTSHKKDPRIGVTIGHKQIKKYGTRIR